MARVINLLGAHLPGTLMSANEDNPKGYWESREIISLNNAMLTALNSSWSDDRNLYLQPQVTDDYCLRCAELLNSYFPGTSPLIIKDPRLCRLMQVWLKAAQNIGADTKILVIVRHPMEVADSLLKRLENRAFAPAAIVCKKKALLLWLRYVLEAEFFTRNTSRAFLTYDALLKSEPDLFVKIKKLLQIGIPEPSGADEKLLGDFIDPALKRNTAGSNFHQNSFFSMVAGVYSMFEKTAGEDLPVEYRQPLDNWSRIINNVEARYAPLRDDSAKFPNEKHVWPEQLSSAISRHYRLNYPRKISRIIYVSGQPNSKGHIYRVENPVKAFNDIGISAQWISIEKIEEAIDKIAGFDLVIIFRAEWDESLKKLCRLCRSRSIPIGFDIDDLIFMKRYMNPKYFDYLRSLGQEEQTQWQNRAINFRKTLYHSDFAIVPTDVLGAKILEFNRNSFVIPNGFDDARLENAEKLLINNVKSCKDDFIRIGYASGTPTHQRDFKTISSLLARILNDFGQTKLVIVGSLDLEEYPELAPCQNRIETRSMVPFDKLPYELSRFDINIAPLEIGNPFCEAKSELKYFEAAIVKVPTVASATKTMRAAIIDGDTGYCASGDSEWYGKLANLLDSPEIRKSMGCRAKYHAIAKYSTEPRRDLLCSMIRIIEETPVNPKGKTSVNFKLPTF